PFQIFPDQASTLAPRTDGFFYFLCGLSILVSVIIVAMLFYLSLRYRRRTEERAPMMGQSIDHVTTRRLEFLWIAVPLTIFLGIFYWGAKLYAAVSEPPADALTEYVVGKRW